MLREINAVPFASRFCEFLQAARSSFFGAVAVLATAISRIKLKKLTLSDSQATKLSNARRLMVEGTMAIALATAGLTVLSTITEIFQTSMAVAVASALETTQIQLCMDTTISKAFILRMDISSLTTR